MSVAYNVSAVAYAKAVLHALRYPHATVNGVFLGRAQGAGAVDIVDAAPLTHQLTALTAMPEVALNLVRARLSGMAGCVLVGV